ncbi:MAG TPA: hypothetical protein VHE30_13185 [Polyangiaceae bacterium]|nr:hypothetical protein [Polyangiaceae bacterium]
MRRLTRICLRALTLAGALHPRVALAERASPARTEARRAEFRADRVVLEPNDERLQLEGNVVVVADRYRLTSDRLKLSRGPRGIRVEGSGRVSLCPCPDPPVTIGFRAANVAPPTDLLLEGPTVRAFGVPILWLPYLWLRAPSRPGLLPLRVGYRGDDGLFLGSGVHLPVSSDTTVELGAGGYVLGGAEVDARVTTTHTTSSVRWDAFRSSAVAVDARGWDERGGGGSVAYSVDALRGARALVGPGELEEVAQRRDRARFFAGGVSSGFVAGLLPRAELARGGAYDAFDAVGPGAYAGFGAALGDAVDLDASVATVSYRRGGGSTTSLVLPRVEAHASTRLGPVSLSGAARGRVLGVVSDDAGASTVLGTATVVAETPFVRTFGEGATLQHWVVPRAFGTVGGLDGGTPLGIPFAEGALGAAGAGLRSTFGETDERRAALAIDGHVATIGTGAGESIRVATARAIASARGAALSVDGTTRIHGARSDSIVAVVRLGPEDGPYVAGHAEGLRGEPLPVARNIARGEDGPIAPTFGVAGWSAGGRVGVPWTRSLSTTADVAADLTRSELLAVRGAAAYRHPCGCLAIALWAGHRLGRGEASLRGVDSFITVDLMPAIAP